MFVHTGSIYDGGPQSMNHFSTNTNTRYNATIKFRLSQQLLCMAQEAARQRQESLSAILRRYLEAYASEQPLRRAE